MPLSSTTPYVYKRPTYSPTSELPVTVPVAVQASKCTDDDVYYYDQSNYVKITISVRIDNSFVFSEKPKMSVSFYNFNA